VRDVGRSPQLFKEKTSSDESRILMLRYIAYEKYKCVLVAMVPVRSRRGDDSRPVR
jgi:hypothetical protein